MKFAVALPPHLRARVASVTAHHDTVVDAGSCCATLATAARSADVIVCDPAVLDDGSCPGLAPALTRSVIYTEATPTAMRLAFGLASHGAVHVLLSGYDDSPQALVDAIMRARTSGFVTHFLTSLAGELANVPVGLRIALTRCAQRPRCANIDSLCSEARISRRSCERWLVAAGLPSLRRLLKAFTIAQALPLLLDGSFSLADVSAHVGVSSPARLSAMIREVFGITSKRLRGMSSDRLVASLAAYARQLPSDALEHADAIR